MRARGDLILCVLCALLRLIRSEVRVKPQRTQRTQRFGIERSFASLCTALLEVWLLRENSLSRSGFRHNETWLIVGSPLCGRFSLSSELPTRKAFEGLDFGSLSRTSCSKSDGSSLDSCWFAAPPPYAFFAAKFPESECRSYGARMRAVQRSS